MEVRPYNPQSKKLDPKTISGYFIGYCVESRGSKFYCSSHTTRVIESDRAIYFEDDTGTSQGPREIVFKEHPVFIPVPIAFTPISSPVVDQYPVATADDEPIEDVNPITLDVNLVVPDVVMDIPLKGHRERVGPQFQMSPQSKFWIDAMKDEMTSMSHNKVWSLIDFPNVYRPIGENECSRLSTMLRDNKVWTLVDFPNGCRLIGANECSTPSAMLRDNKARLVAKGYSQRESIDFKEIFSLVSSKDSLSTIMVIVTHFDLKLH